MAEEAQTDELITEFYEGEEHIAFEMLTKGQIHLGYWDEHNADASFWEGAWKLTQLMIDQVDVEPGQRFCDLGCGVGGPAVELIRQKKCLVDGVTLSPYQRHEAQKRVKEAGLENRASFHVENALELPFDDTSFDGGWFFESIFHMGHQEALKEAQRVLKPGATIVLTDVADIGKLSAEDKQEAKDLLNVEYRTLDDYPDMLRETGFELVMQRDISKHVIAPFGEKFGQALQANKDAVFDILKHDQERFDAFASVTDKFDKVGYVMVKARRL